MIKLGIIGYPLAHSLSSVMHEAALSHLGMVGCYKTIETPAEDLLDRVKQLKIEGFRGFNVTIPLKVWITPLLHEVDDNANVAGAVNTVVINPDKTLSGYNTDIYGFISAIPKEIRSDLNQRHAVVLGAGGAARAVCVGLAQLGIGKITVYARELSKGDRLKEVMNTAYPEVSLNTKQFNDYADLFYADIVVNTTPLGMYGDSEGISPLTSRSLESLPKTAIVYDIVYKPRETKFIQYAKKAGLTVIDGSEMLVLQGAKAFELWTGEIAPVEVMRNALLERLQ